MESLPWKWWAKKEANYDNLKIEIVDVMHFWLSLVLLKYTEEKLQLIPLSYFTHGYFSYYTSLEKTSEQAEENEKIKAIIKAIDNLVTRRIGNLEDFSFYFGRLIAIADISIEELIELYRAKNELNVCRQEMGYKEGKYKKVIDGKEDNEILMEKFRKP
jgi:hypothetical protein